jgi:long-chain-fatty-acid--[acyl-carrier-protein] ligase
MLATLAKALLSLRYDVTVTGLETITQRKGVLIIPNHPAEIDPIILSTYLWDLLKPQPVVLETMYELPFLKPLMRWVHAIPMPDMEFDSGPYKRRRIERALVDVSERLRQGQNILIYPSGRLSITGEERLGAASGLHTILRNYPDVFVAMVRIKGLYGSIFSKALTGGETPDVGLTIMKGLSLLFKNLLFLAPKRKVTIEIVANPSELPRYSDPLPLNRYLESYYNAPAPEAPTLVPHLFWSQEVPQVPEKTEENHSYDEIPPAIKEKVFNHIAHIGATDTSRLTTDTELGDDLGLDSLTVAELLLWLDREFEAHDIELSELVTVGSVLRAAAGQLGSKKPRREYRVPGIWNTSVEKRPLPLLPSSPTIAEAFLLTANSMQDLPAIGDARSGVLSWAEVKLRVIMVARYLAPLPDSHIGLLFPASVGGSLAAMATILAGKIPVFLNWTSGKRALLHACETTGLRTILSSQAFLDIVQTDLEFLEERFVFLETLRDALTLRDKIAGKRLAGESLPQILEAFNVKRRSSKDPAVVLFTSGSEALPKGVVLTHENLLSNIRGVLEAFPLRRDDVLLGFLPTFHSFGLTVCTLLPLVTGLRVAYHPNPNESRKIAKIISHWGASIMAGTPTFLRSILQAGQAEQFATLRTLISGAERAPEDLFERVKNLPHPVEVIEGYGITECSPVVSLTRPGEPRVGVGRPLLGTTIKIVNPATYEELPHGTDGLILIHSPSVFPGYLEPKLNPFLEIHGIRYYNSGDIGRLENGSLVITGRLKRFIKIAGEMVSLTAVEEALQKSVPSYDDAPSIAVLARGTEGDGRPTLTLFTSTQTTAEAANKILRDSGFPHLVAISNVMRLRDLPLLGSGKTDYQALKGMM